MWKRVLRKIEHRLVASDDGKLNVLKSSWEFRDLGLLWPFSVRFYVLWVWVIFLVTLGNTRRWIFASWSPRFLFLTVRDTRNSKRGFTRRGYGNSYKVMITMGFWLFICLLRFPSTSSAITVAVPDLELRGRGGSFDMLKQNWFANIAYPASFSSFCVFSLFHFIFFAKIRGGLGHPSPSPRSATELHERIGSCGGIFSFLLEPK